MSRPRHPKREWFSHRIDTEIQTWVFSYIQVFATSCSSPPPQIEPLSGLLEGGTLLTISGSNLGQKVEDILQSVLVAGIPCSVIPSLYEVSSRYSTCARCA